MDRKEFLALCGPVTAVPSWYATPELKKRALSRFDSLRIVADLRRDSTPDVLAALIELASGIAPARPRQADCLLLMADIEKAIESGRLLFVEGWEFFNKQKSASQSAAMQEKPHELLVQRLMDDQDHIEFEGKKYRWASTTVRRSSDAEGYHPVPAAELIPLVKRMAPKVANTPDQKAAWADIEKENTSGGADNWQRAAGKPILLRLAPTVVPSRVPSASPAVTPSQVQSKPASEHWIELEIVYDDGTPFDGNCAVELPGGRISDGSPNGKGVVRIDALSSAGDCKITFPKLDGDAFAAK
ncbi:MAG: hypothetical protein QOI66_28 [Myxococcales bacterium]|jgi:hypothetical protein|nr:hypothetical protein [Myxococcales bacterium]